MINFDLFWWLIVKIIIVEIECLKIMYMFFFCVFKDVDGGWSFWGYWFECSVICGDLSVRKCN